MERQGLRSYDDIVKYLEYISNEYNKDFEELNSIKIGVFEFSGKKEKEDKQRELRRKLINYVVSYEQCDKFLKDSTTFRRQDFVKFLADYFSLAYGKKYVIESGISDKKQVHQIITYDLIISEEDLKGFRENDNMIKNLNFNELFDRCNDCCLLLDNSLKFTLLDGINLSSDFEDFPELMSAARSLVNLKLSKPEMSDQRRLLSVLNGTSLDLDGGSQEVESSYNLRKTYPKSE